jgi:AraC family transcriptional regulator
VNYSFASRPHQTIVDHNIGRSYFGVNLAPLLSVKCMFNGQARYVADGRREFIVDDSCYVILNEDNAYTIEKRSLTRVETFCVFIPSGMADAVARVTTTADDELLGYEDLATGTFNFLEHRRPHGDLVSTRMHALRSVLAAREVCDAWLEEQLYGLVISMLEGERAVLHRVAKLPPMRVSTRREVFRRVQRGCDYLHANLASSLSLRDVAKAAAMSPYHFLRSFRTVFGTTPFAYLSSVRLHKATQLLRQTHLSVTEIAATVGFESPTSFSNLFRRTYSASPARYREQHRK